MKNILIAAFLIFVIGLGIRSRIGTDNRFGWGMYSSKVRYNTNYYWVYENGKTKRYHPKDELYGKSKDALRDDRRRTTHYGLGALFSWIEAYSEYMYLNLRPENAIAFKTVVKYSENLAPKKQRATIVYPAEYEYIK